MSVQFEMVGKLSIGKETEKFKPYDETKYNSGWINRTLKFNVLSGLNRFMLQIKGGCYEDGSNDIFVFSKDGVDDNGNKVKGEGFKIPFKERLTHHRINEIVEWKKFIIDLEIPGRRWSLQKALDDLKEGKEISEEELSKLGVEKQEDLESAYKESCKKRKEFISEWDYAEFIKKVIDSEKYKDKKFRIRGERQFQYSEENNRFYDNRVPTRIYLVNDDEEEMATESAVVYFNSESLVDATDEKGKYFVNSKIFVYESKRKANIPCDYTFVFNDVLDDSDEKAKKMVNAKVKLFTVDDDKWKELGVVNTLLDGAQKLDIKFEDLDEETQDNILMGLTTLEDVIDELGGSKFGDNIRESVFTKLGRGYSKGAKDTVYTDEDMVIKPIVDEESEKEDLFDADDLFDEDELF